MGNLKISTRLYAGFTLLIAVMVAIVSVAFIEMNSLRAAANEIATNALPSVQETNRLNTQISDFRILEMQHALSIEEGTKQDLEKRLDKTQEAIKETKARYEPLISSPEERAGYEEFNKYRKLYLDLHKDIKDYSRRNDAAGAAMLLEAESKRL